MHRIRVVQSGIWANELEERPPQVSVWSCKVAGEAFASSSTAKLLLCQEPRPQRDFRGFLLLDDLMRYVDGQVWDTRLHEQARAGSVGEFLERGG